MGHRRTTAPVIGLAAIVSLTDALRENGDSINAGVRIQQDDIEEHYRAVDIAIKTGGEIQAAMDSPYPNRDRADQLMNDSRKWAIRLFVVGAINLILQAALLAVSLVSIADDSDLVPAPYAIAAAVGGLVLLTVSAFGALHLRLQRGNTQRSVQR